MESNNKIKKVKDWQKMFECSLCNSKEELIKYDFENLLWKFNICKHCSEKSLKEALFNSELLPTYELKMNEEFDDLKINIQ